MNLLTDGSSHGPGIDDAHKFVGNFPAWQYDLRAAALDRLKRHAEDHTAFFGLGDGDAARLADADHLIGPVVTNTGHQHSDGAAPINGEHGLHHHADSRHEQGLWVVRAAQYHFAARLAEGTQVETVSGHITMPGADRVTRFGLHHLNGTLVLQPGDKSRN